MQPSDKNFNEIMTFPFQNLLYDQWQIFGQSDDIFASALDSDLTWMVITASKPRMCYYCQ